MGAAAFSIDVHRALTERALAGTVGRSNLAVPVAKDLVDFWMWVGAALAYKTESVFDQGEPDRFMARYPTPRAFDAFAIRGFLGLRQTQEPPIWGLDTFDHSAVLDRLATIAAGSTFPDLDRRNQDRFAYDAQRDVVRLPDGRPVPADPAALNMGEATGLSSQAHAHYQLGTLQPSADPAVLQERPWDFAIPLGFPAGKVETSAARMAQIHLDLAVLAKTWGEGEFHSSGEYFALTWLGAGLHYVQDVAGPLHTVQVGAYDLFVKAKVAHTLRALATGGGVWGELPTFGHIGMNFLRNHHLTAEAWLSRELTELDGGRAAHPAVAAAWKLAGEDDPELLQALTGQLEPYLTGLYTLQPWDDGEGAGSLLVRALAKLGAQDGAAMYAAITLAGAATLTALHTVIADDSKLRPELLGDPNDPDVKTATDTMARLHAKSVRRATTAARLYWKAFVNGNSDAAARRLRRNCLRLLESTEKTRAVYRLAPPPASGQAEVQPWWAAAEVGGVLLAGGAVVGFLRRRRRKGAA
ncbi:MAG: hypothetical protein EXR79_13350 [Myxococcales bacterium]|nr:hypothetical protein [Myxococcales bacterium]